MGIYDVYGDLGIQMKITRGTMDIYKVGDKTPLADGIYLGREGAFAVKDGIVILEAEFVYDKWGAPLDCNSIIDEARGG